MQRAAVAALLAGAVALLGGCDPDTVTLDARPEVGDRASHRYELEATITRSLDDDEPTASDVDITIETQAEVLAVTPEGVRAEVTIRRKGAEPTTAQVLLGPGGTLESLELVEGLPADAAALGGFGGLLGAAAAPPEGPLRPGARWEIDEDGVTGEGRLDRLGIEDGREVAVVSTRVIESLADADSEAGASALESEIRTRATVTYDLADGTVRGSESTSSGSVEALIEPPAGVTAEPVRATIRFDVTVRVVRLR
jgi:hypothetical protein